MRHGHRFFHISEMKFAFKTKFDNMTYEFYLKQPNLMLEWNLFENVAKNPRLMLETDRTIYHPVTHANEPIQDEDE